MVVHDARLRRELRGSLGVCVGGRGRSEACGGEGWVWAHGESTGEDRGQDLWTGPMVLALG